MTIEDQLGDIVDRVVRRALREELDRRSRIEDKGDGYLSIAQAAAFASVSKSTVRRWITSGDLPACRHESVIRVRRADLVALLAPDFADDVIDFDAKAAALLAKRSGK